MELAHLWPTIIAQERVDIPDSVRDPLIKLIVTLDEQERASGQVTKYQEYGAAPEFRRNANLFTAYPEMECLRQFEQIAIAQYRSYLRAAFQIPNAEIVALAGNCMAIVQVPGERSMPHYHHGCDGVLIHYLDVGTDTQPAAHPNRRNGNGATLILQDPRPSPAFPWWNKLHKIEPYNGLTIVHPGYLWHETNTWQGPGNRVCIVVNFRIGNPPVFRC